MTTTFRSPPVLAPLAYSGNDGSRNFTSAWMETDFLGGGAADGLASVVDGIFRLQGADANVSDKRTGIRRSVDLSGARHVELTILFLLTGTLETNDRVLIEVS